MEATDLTIVIVSHNTRDLLRECLGTLWSGQHQTPFRVTVIDNASRDGSADMVEQEFPQTELVANRANLGYSRAVNQAIRAADSRYFLILNPDIRAHPGSIDALVRFMEENPEVGVSGGRLLNPDGTLQYSCRSFYTFRTLLYRRTFLGRLFPNSRVIRDHLMADWDHAEVRSVDWVLGACMIVRQKAIEDVGLMDERFFLYFEDVDWCYRMKRRGWKVCYVPQAEMVHHHRRQSAQGITDARFLTHLNSVFHFYDKWNRALFVVKKYRRQFRTLLFLFSDLVGINAAFVVAYLVRHLLRVWLVKPVFPLSTYLLFLVFVNVTTVLSFYGFGLYRSRPGEGRGEEIVRLARAAFAGFLILMAATFLAQTKLYSRAMIYFFWPLVVAFAAGGRLLLYRLHDRLREMRFDLRRALLIGSGPDAARLEEELYIHPELGFEVVGAIDTGEGPSPGAPHSLRESWRLADLLRIIRDEQLEEVLVCGSEIATPVAARVVADCREQGIGVTLISDTAELVALGGRLVSLGGEEALGFEPAPWRAATAAAKRLMDISVAGVGLLLVPWFLLGRLPRKLRGKPVLSRRLFHRRGGGEFGALELADVSPASFWGSLPQVWNVLRGEMSVVGPRPRTSSDQPPPREGGVKEERMRPGMTGLWRIAGSDQRSMDEMDRRYLRGWSLSLDLHILAETVLGMGPRARGGGITEVGDPHSR